MSKHRVDPDGRPPDRPLPSIGAGFAAGLATTALLNPWDRALYLSIVHRRSFFAKDNWRSPYRGLLQTLVQRSVSSGLYFPLEERFAAALGSHALGGPAAGAMMALLLNPLSLIKYHTWGVTEERRWFMTTARRLYRDAGPMVFARAAFSSALRDATFGLCFGLRKHFPRAGGEPATPTQEFAAAIGCAAAGTALSSPFNYVRNMTYAEQSHVPLESFRSAYTFWRRVLGELAKEAREHPTLRGRVSFLQGRLRLGWGTARVAVGMAITDQIYSTCCRAQGV
mmetsp:Transcript_43413/g.114804  ORF Transcript_43413/g.114804 Transcript_43413/m.114804 type:complete len:282 (-) Transcript_43413:12-857(-)